MDRGHLRILRRWRRRARGTSSASSSNARERWRDEEVPDPYYGGAGEFEQVLDMVEEAAERWVDRFQEALDPGAFRLRGLR